MSRVLGQGPLPAAVSRCLVAAKLWCKGVPAQWATRTPWAEILAILKFRSTKLSGNADISELPLGSDLSLIDPCAALKSMHRRSGSSPGGGVQVPARETRWMKAALLAIFLAAAYLGLRVAPAVLASTGGSAAAARRAAAHLMRRLEEGSEVVADLGSARRAPDLFLLRPGRTVLLPSAVDSSGALRPVSKAGLASGDLSSVDAATTVLYLPLRAAQAAAPAPDGPAALEPLTGLSAARTARVHTLASVPPDFDWRIYLAYYPELRGAGVSTEGAAREHYARQGRAEVHNCTSCTALVCCPTDAQCSQPARSRGWHSIALCCCYAQ